MDFRETPNECDNVPIDSKLECIRRRQMRRYRALVGIQGQRPVAAEPNHAIAQPKKRTINWGLYTKESCRHIQSPEWKEECTAYFLREGGNNPAPKRPNLPGLPSSITPGASIGVRSADWMSVVGDPQPYTIAGQNLFVYTIPRGTHLYHGTSTNVTASNIHEKSNWFGDRSTASIYAKNNPSGVIYKFEVTRSIHLLAMDRCVTVQAFRNIFANDPNTRLLLQSAFRCANGGIGQPNRASLSDIDNALVQKICLIDGVNGYASKELNDNRGLLFHAEVFFCDPAKFIKTVSQGAVLQRELGINVGAPRLVAPWSPVGRGLAPQRVAFGPSPWVTSPGLSPPVTQHPIVIRR